MVEILDAIINLFKNIKKDSEIFLEITFDIQNELMQLRDAGELKESLEGNAEN
jgi:hypothetical protein